jgi:hypothetical protein
MPQVKGTVQPGKSISYKGVQYTAGDVVTFQKEVHAARFEKLDLIKLDRETSHKVEEAVEKIKEKNEKAGPNAPKTKN